MSAAAWTLLLLLLALVNNLASILGIQNFLTGNPAIANEESMNAYKQLVRSQMYQSAGQFVVLWISLLLGLYGFIEKQWGSTLLLLGVSLGIGIFLSDRAASKAREQARSLPAADKGLEGIHRAISLVWTSKTLPDF